MAGEVVGKARGDPPDREYIRLEQATEFLGISKRTIENWITYRHLTAADGLRRVAGSYPVRSRGVGDTKRSWRPINGQHASGPTRGRGEDAVAMENPVPFSSLPTSPVNSYNEWDPLEEVIVGRLERATVPTSHITVAGSMPAYMRALYRLMAGRSYPGFLLRAAQKELNELLQILKGEGIVVRRPEIFDFRARVNTPHWSSTGYCVACPRDGVLIVGPQIIETAMSWPSRQFEMLAYRSLFKEYSQKGAQWISAPRPALSHELFNYNYPLPNGDSQFRSYILNEFEPVFDAADFARCGQDLLVLLCHKIS